MVQDIKTNELGEVLIVNGDFELSESDDAHVQDIIESFKGEWKQHPLLGVGIIQYLNSPVSQTNKEIVKKEIAIQLEYDDVTVNDIELVSFENVIIDCERF